MSDHVYEKIEVVGSSAVSIEDAVKNAVAKVAETRKNLRWLEVVETRCHLENEAVAHWQVTVRIGARAD
jgi:flavin-binding protein dodecin